MTKRPKVEQPEAAPESGSGDVLSEMLIRGQDKHASIGLINEDESPADEEQFSTELGKALADTQQVARELGAADGAQARSWSKAREIVERFRPVPWFIWRLSNYVLGQPGQIRPVSDGAVLGLRRLLFAAASDPFLGNGRKVSGVHQALQVVPPDVIAASAVIHAVCRRLARCDFERIWRPILDDALLRSQIGFLVGERVPSFGPGRGMLAGFAGRCGLAILIASGTLEQARKSLELLASGEQISKAGLTLYGCDPLQISAMTLSAAGCGRDAAFGTVRFANPILKEEAIDSSQMHWLSAFTIVEMLRISKYREVGEAYWEALGYSVGQDRADLAAVSDSMLRGGQPWAWIL